MSEAKGRGYSDSRATLILKGDSIGEIQGMMDDANSLADELREANQLIVQLRKDIAELTSEVDGLREASAK